MHIRIIKSKEGYWYNKKEGDIFPVEQYERGNGNHEGLFYVKDKGFVSEKDCIVYDWEERG